MKITIFGSTGETGLLVIKRALEEGYSVTAYARTPSKIPFQNDNLTILKGELDEGDKIQSAIQGVDAVISLLGPKGKTVGLTISDGIKNIIAAMEKHNVKRLIATATPSFADPKDKKQFSFRFAVFMIKNLMKDAYNNIVEIGKSVTHSSLDWTLVRLPLLTRKPATGKLNIGYPGHGKVKLNSLNREDLAEFLVKQIKDKTYLRQSPVVSN